MISLLLSENKGNSHILTFLQVPNVIEEVNKVTLAHPQNNREMGILISIFIDKEIDAHRR